MITFETTVLIAIVWAVVGGMFFCCINLDKLNKAKTYKLFIAMFIAGPLFWIFFLFAALACFLEDY